MSLPTPRLDRRTETERIVAPPGKKRRSVVGRRDALRGWIFVSPAVLLVVFLFLVPVGLVAVMSGSEWSLLGGYQGSAGGDNFQAVVEDPLLMDAVWFTVKYTVLTTIILMPVAFLLALLVQQVRKWNSFLRTAILVPSALGIASASLLFYALYSPQIGPLNPLLDALGLMDINESILGSPNGALWATVLLVVWRFAGYYMILMMVGLHAVPDELYEAASLDGASKIRQLWTITLPLLRPTIAMTMILSITGSLLAFDQFFILTRGGPNNSTMTVVLLIYRYAFETRRDLGLAAALSVIVLIALVVVNVFQLRALGTRKGE